MYEEIMRERKSKSSRQKTEVSQWQKDTIEDMKNLVRTLDDEIRGVKTQLELFVRSCHSCVGEESYW